MKRDAHDDIDRQKKEAMDEIARSEEKSNREIEDLQKRTADH